MKELIYEIFKISIDEINSDKRKFHYDDNKFKNHIEEIGKSFVFGYNNSLKETSPDFLSEILNKNINKNLLGFAYEGAAMGLLVSDFFKPWSNDFVKFLNGPGNTHEYMLYVGAGWAVARLPFKKYLFNKVNKNNSILINLVFDGIGFHDGYFKGTKDIKKKTPRYLKDYQCNCYDQGVGRSLWFLCGGNPERISKSIKGFKKNRHADLWSGVGLASTYAGGNINGLEKLKRLSGKFYPDLAQGCCFASKARERAKNINTNTRKACRSICGITVEKAAKLTDLCLDSNKDFTYQEWQAKIKNNFR